ncbi:hypothetical protein HII31_10135 [Pseudocercospora fuligena]|uniref:BTB domain-containing protein n=1 Tax=Pseudocercospora fuligena TaxID=685502 RepID=A0A8H6VDM5_9PEZI|nr:hypothetical protein HII31_10135 [Pseudocercospora fuligena]
MSENLKESIEAITRLRYQAAMSQVSSLDWIKAKPVSLKVIDDSGEVHSFATLSIFLTAHSKYFKTLIEGSWRDSKTDTVTIDDHPPWVVACVVAWLYTQKLTLVGYPGEPYHSIEEAPYRLLFELYRFCEFYDISALRTIIIKKVQLQMNRSKVLKLTDMPDEADVAWLLENMPFESLLLRAVDLAFSALRDNNSDEVLAKVPSSMNLSKSKDENVLNCKTCMRQLFAPSVILARHYGVPDIHCPQHTEAQLYEAAGVNNTQAWCLLHHEHPSEEEYFECHMDTPDLMRKIAGPYATWEDAD